MENDVLGFMEFVYSQYGMDNRRFQGHTLVSVWDAEDADIIQMSSVRDGSVIIDTFSLHPRAHDRRCMVGGCYVGIRSIIPSDTDDMEYSMMQSMRVVHRHVLRNRDGMTSAHHGRLYMMTYGAMHSTCRRYDGDPLPSDASYETGHDPNPSSDAGYGRIAHSV